MTEVSLADQLVLAAWDGLDDISRQRLIDAVARRVAPTFRYVETRTCALGEQSRRIAIFAHNSTPFALVPGATAALGWDGAPLSIEPARRTTWASGAEEMWGVTSEFEDHVRDVMTASRAVAIPALLVELEPSPALDYIEDEALENEDLELHDALVAAVAVDGFRLPSSDEWEYLCRGGSAALFRWGDTWPDGEPFANDTTFDLHRFPNGFGLTMIDNPYQVECVLDEDVYCGGDGGSILCGGAPSPEAWTTFASAYRLPVSQVEDCLEELFEEAYARRVFEIP
jgi:hypothetical protein